MKNHITTQNPTTSPDGSGICGECAVVHGQGARIVNPAADALRRAIAQERAVVDCERAQIINAAAKASDSVRPPIGNAQAGDADRAPGDIEYQAD